jgi:large subunit ribosomal protein L29
MKATELRKKTKDELGTMLVDLSKEKFNLKMQKGTGQLARPDQVKKVRRDIARIHTLINQIARS